LLPRLLPGDDPGMRAKLSVLVLALGLAGAISVVASAHIQANGLPTYTDGYAKWTKINKRPVTTPGAHNGVKNVFTSKRKVGKAYPNGTVIVKSIADPGTKGLPRQVAVMRKVKGRWQWVEYARSGSRYSAFARGQICVSCHMQARSNDWVFTRG
jgi:hypothetical protein